VGGLSAHADQGELIRWLKDFTIEPERIFLIHGEPSAQESLRVKIKDELGRKAIILKQDHNEFLFDMNG
jgi:metallo-beta-lactamase family protein